MFANELPPIVWDDAVMAPRIAAIIRTYADEPGVDRNLFWQVRRDACRAFAALQGWRYMGRRAPKWAELPAEPYQLLDHEEFYRCGNGRSAVVTHLYRAPTVLPPDILPPGVVATGPLPASWWRPG